MNRAALLLAAFSFLGISCERHSWEETKVLHQHGKSGHGEDHGEANSNAHGAHGDAHGAKDAAAEKEHH